MNTEQREEIEKACKDLEFYDGQEFLPRCCEEDVRMLVKFARQQLTLRVDGEKLMDKLEEDFEVSLDHSWQGAAIWIVHIPRARLPKLEALVLECLTTTPEEKE